MERSGDACTPPRGVGIRRVAQEARASAKRDCAPVGRWRASLDPLTEDAGQRAGVLEAPFLNPGFKDREAPIRARAVPHAEADCDHPSGSWAAADSTSRRLRSGYRQDLHRSHLTSDPGQAMCRGRTRDCRSRRIMTTSDCFYCFFDLRPATDGRRRTLIDASVVERKGIEPSTFALRRRFRPSPRFPRYSTACPLKAPKHWFYRHSVSITVAHALIR